MDGSLGSAANLDLLADEGLDDVLVVTAVDPCAPPESLDGLWWAALETALDALCVPSLVIHPGEADLAAMGADRLRLEPAGVLAGIARGAQMSPSLAA